MHIRSEIKQVAELWIIPMGCAANVACSSQGHSNNQMDEVVMHTEVIKYQADDLDMVGHLYFDESG